jgi:3-O-alpha-D-mannopyranosyl-alpha-D-mannopyranose xylosylphosphotransferase
MALVTASGPLGLSAFLPPKGTSHINRPPQGAWPKYLPPPHLPLTPTWHEADFSLENVLSITALPDEEVDLRQYTMRLLSRYQYLSGASGSSGLKLNAARSHHHFHMLKVSAQRYHQL